MRKAMVIGSVMLCVVSMAWAARYIVTEHYWVRDRMHLLPMGRNAFSLQFRTADNPEVPGQRLVVYRLVANDGSGIEVVDEWGLIPSNQIVNSASGVWLGAMLGIAPDLPGMIQWTVPEK